MKSKIAVILTLWSIANPIARADQYRLVAKLGDHPEGTTASTSSFSNFTNYDGSEVPIIAPNGRIAFRSLIGGGSAVSLNGEAIFTADANEVVNGQQHFHLIAQKNDTFLGSTTTRLNRLSNLQFGRDSRLGFQTTLTNSNSSTGFAYWSSMNGSLDFMIRSGTPRDGYALSSILSPRVEGSPLVGYTTGHNAMMSFRSAVPGYTRWGLYSASDSRLEQIAVTNSELSAVPGFELSSSTTTYSSGSGGYLISSYLAPLGGNASTNDSALFLYNSPSLVLAVRAVQQVFQNSDYIFTSLYSSGRQPVINSFQTAAFTANFNDPSSGQGLWRLWQPGFSGRQLLVKTNDWADDAHTLQFSSLAITGVSQNIFMANDSIGTTALYAQLSGNVDSTNDRSVWLFGDGSSRQLILRGNQEIAPGKRVLNSSIGGDLVMNNRGEVVIRVQLDYGDRYPNALLFYGPRGLKIIAEDHQQIGDSEYWLSSLTGALKPQLNNLGQVAFKGGVDFGDHPDSYGTPALLRVDQNGFLKVVAGVGQIINPGEPSLSVISTPRFSEVASLSDTGELTFGATMIGTTQQAAAIYRVAIEPEVTTPPRNPADIDESGTVTQSDLFLFLGLYFSASPSAEMDGRPGITTGDIFAYLDLWFASRT